MPPCRRRPRPAAAARQATRRRGGAGTGARHPERAAAVARCQLRRTPRRQSRRAAGDDADEIDAVQALRYRVFYQEMGARADARHRRRAARPRRFRRGRRPPAGGRPRPRRGPEAVVGTYRLIRRPAAAQARAVLLGGRIRHRPASLAFPGRMLELGRSCVDAAYRTRGTLQLLWRGIAAYVFQHRIDADVRLRQPARHRPRCAGAGADLPVRPTTWRRRRCARARCRDRYVDMRRLRPGAARRQARAGRSCRR